MLGFEELRDQAVEEDLRHLVRVRVRGRVRICDTCVRGRVRVRGRGGVRARVRAKARVGVRARAGARFRVRG